MFIRPELWQTAASQRPRWRRVAAAGAAGTALTVLAAGGIAAASSKASPNTITACYKPAKAPAPLTVPPGTTCPAKQTTLTWNKVGPQGPPGPAPGVSAATAGGGSLSSAAWTKVLTASPAPATGVYYATASVGLAVAANSLAGCEFATSAGTVLSPLFATEAPGAGQRSTLSLTYPLILTAGQVLSVQCAVAAGSSAIVQDSAMTAMQVSQPIAAARARARRFPGGPPSLRR